MAPLKVASLMLAAWRGNESKALELFEAGRREATARGEGVGLAILEWATALLYNGHGRYAEALAAAQRGCEHDDAGLFAWSLVELIEAGVRSGATGRGRRRARSPERAHASERHRLGARHRGRLTRAAERRTTMRSRSTARRSSGSRAAVAWSTSPAPGSCTANGCVARAAASTRVSNSEPPTRCSAASGPRGLPSAPVTSSWPRVRPRAGAPTTRAACSHPRRHTSLGWPEMVSPTPRSAHNCSSAPARSQYHLRKVFLKLDITSRNQLSRVPASHLTAA